MEDDDEIEREARAAFANAKREGQIRSRVRELLREDAQSEREAAARKRATERWANFKAWLWVIFGLILLGLFLQALEDTPQQPSSTLSSD